MMETKKRFVLTTAETIGEEPDYEGCPEDSKKEWWLDTMRPIKGAPGFVAVQTYKGKNPNDFVKCTDMRILFTDQAECYFVCKDCYSVYRHMQWSGGTRAGSGWRERAEKRLENHEKVKGWCQFCDPIFGNGGWSL